MQEGGHWSPTGGMQEQVQGARGLWYSIRDLFFYPGDMVVRALAEHSPAFASYLGQSHANMAGIFSGIISIVVWVTLFSLLMSVMRLLRGGSS